MPIWIVGVVCEGTARLRRFRFEISRTVPLMLAWRSAAQAGRKPIVPQVFGTGPVRLANQPAPEAGWPFDSMVYLYVYVVEVNKGHTAQWITVVYADDSMRCRTHNRLHRLCGHSGLR